MGWALMFSLAGYSHSCIQATAEAVSQTSWSKQVTSVWESAGDTHEYTPDAWWLVCRSVSRLLANQKEAFFWSIIVRWFATSKPCVSVGWGGRTTAVSWQAVDEPRWAFQRPAQGKRSMVFMQNCIYRQQQLKTWYLYWLCVCICFSGQGNWSYWWRVSWSLIFHTSGGLC